MTNSGIPSGMDYSLDHSDESGCYELRFTSDRGFENGEPVTKMICEDELGGEDSKKRIDIRATDNLQECPYGGIEYRFGEDDGSGQVNGEPEYICAGEPAIPDDIDDGGDSSNLSVDCRENALIDNVLKEIICEVKKDGEVVDTLFSYFSFDSDPALADESVMCEFNVAESPLGDDLDIHYSYQQYDGKNEIHYKLLRLSVNGGSEWPLFFTKGSSSEGPDIFYDQSIAFLPGFNSDNELEGYFAGRIFEAKVDLDGEDAGVHEVFQLVFFDVAAMDGNTSTHPDSEEIEDAEIDPDAGSGVYQLAVHPAFEPIGSIDSVCTRTTN